uniref:DDE Tnp4 domain-containing protein n=1 Tax=Anopheles minimus TaxID=112268 RepID=A0A182VR67_9DIPT
MKSKAGIMKIHNSNTNPPHEKVRTRSVVSKEAQEANGTVRRAAVGRASAKQQQKPTQKAAASAPASNLSPELENTANRLTLEAGKRGRRRGLPKQPEEHDGSQEEEEVEDEEDEQVVEDKQQLTISGTVKRRRLEKSAAQQLTQQEAQHTDEEEPNHRDTSETLENNVQHETTEEEEQEEYVGNESQVEDLNEDDRTSSSTVSAEETLDQVMESFNKGRISTNNNSLRQETARASATVDPLNTMTMDDFQQPQQQQLQNDDTPMDEYEPAVTVVGGSVSASDDIEDTDGALAGNRLFRKKVKRKLPARPPNSSGSTVTNSTAAVPAGETAATSCSSKAKLQMVHEFPMLFLGLRRNRMFLVNSLAQWFDLNQRDIILTLRKIKQNESSVRLGSVFGLGSTEVELLFHKNVPKIADCLRNFIVWPDDITMKLNVPISLRQHFQRIHLILNYLVVRVKQNAVQELPADEIATSFCPNEQCHKLKYLVASTLDGCVCFVSRAFGVQTDDEQVLSQSSFLTKFKTNTNLIAGKNFHNFEDQLANGHDHTNNNGGHGRRNRVTSASRTATGGGAADDDDDLERVLGGSASNSNSVDNFEDIVSEKISKSKTFKLKNYIENILENFQSHQLLSPQTCIDARTLKLLDDIVVIVGALINLQKQEIE